MTAPDPAAPSRPDASPLDALRAAYPSAEALRGALDAELSALAELVGASRAHWQTEQPGREWSPAQEIEHALIVHEGSAKLSRLLASDRPLPPLPSEAGEYRDGRRQAPPSTWPTGAETPEALLTRIEQSRARLNVPEGVDPQRRARHPFLGDLDATDWLRMAAYHTRHHRKLLGRGLAALQSS